MCDERYQRYVMRVDGERIVYRVWFLTKCVELQCGDHWIESAMSYNEILEQVEAGLMFKA